MKASNMNRRDFSRLTVAALGGAMAGTAGLALGQDDTKRGTRSRTKSGSKDKSRSTTRRSGSDKTKKNAADETETKTSKRKKPKRKVEYHICRGLNSCKNNGVDGKNECAGQGLCATVKHHFCAGLNDCKLKEGFCGVKLKNRKGDFDNCKGTADGGIPLFEDVWPQVRKKFEELRTKKRLKIGPAPPTAVAQKSAEVEAEYKRKQEEKDAKDKKKKGAKGTKKKTTKRKTRTPKKKGPATKKKTKKKPSLFDDE